MNKIVNFITKKTLAICSIAIFGLLTNLGAQPVIGSLSSTVAKPGDAITVTGSGFNATAANNIVYFGATRAVVNTATTTSLTVNIPLGATCAPVSVTNTATNLTGYSSAAFMPTYNASDYQQTIVRTDNPFIKTYSGTIGQTTLSDIDGDGKPELVACLGSPGLVAYHNTSTPGVLNATSFADSAFLYPNYVFSFALGDLNGDGKPDAVIYNNNSMVVSKNTSSAGSILFSTQTTLSNGSGRKIKIDDLDGDGKPDIIATTSSSGKVSFFRNTSGTNISFATSIDSVLPTQLYHVATGDIDGDGKPEVIAEAFSTPSIYIFRNISTPGNIAFEPFQTVTIGGSSRPGEIAISDIDGDGHADVVVGGYASSLISVFRNTGSAPGSISLAARVDFTTRFAESVAICDFNGDGKADVLTAGQSITSILLNKGIAGTIDATTFASRIDLGTANGHVASLGIGDIDGDTQPDIAMLDAATQRILVYRNNPFFYPPVISAINPETGTPGSPVTISGSQFGAATAGNIVYFGPTRATVTSASAGSLTVTVPAGAAYGPVSVYNVQHALSANSQHVFTPTYNNSAFQPGIVNMGKPTVMRPGSRPNSITASDFDGDGKADMAVTVGGTGNVVVYRNTGPAGSLSEASFADSIVLTGLSSPAIMSVKDMDGDGKNDLVSTSNSGLRIYLNNSTAGTLSFAAPFIISIASSNIGIADFDGDGRNDLISTGPSTNCSVFGNISQPGSLAFTRQDLSLGSLPGVIAVGDIDNDSKPDFAVKSPTTSAMFIFRNTTTAAGSITFATTVSVSTPTQGGDIAIEDIDNDGVNEVLALGVNTITKLFLWANTSTPGSISLSPRVDIELGFFGASFMAIGDIDGDGKKDLCLTSSVTSNTASIPSANNVLLLRNISTPGTINANVFAPGITYSAGLNLADLFVGDIDNDGRPDIIAADNNFASSEIYLFHNKALLPYPVITGMSASTGKPGDDIVITGSNFSSTASHNIVRFGGTQATVTAASVSSLTVTVPMSAAYGRVSVLNTESDGTGLSTTAFTPTYDRTGYLPYVNYTITQKPLSIFGRGAALGDLDGDGKTDMVLTTFTSDVIAYRNTGTVGSVTEATFTDSLLLNTLSTPNGVSVPPKATIIDIDADGKQDILLTFDVTSSMSGLAVFRNISTPGTMAFEPVQYIARSQNYRSSALGDLDNDGRPDLVTSSTGSYFTFWHNNSTPGMIAFGTKIDSSAVNWAFNIDLADMDGDGKLDVVTSNSTTTELSIYRNTGSRGILAFAPRIIYSLPTSGQNIARLWLADIDNDGKADVINGGGTSPLYLSLFRNTTTSPGSISFGPRYDITGQSSSVMLADADGDGRVDLLTTSSITNPYRLTVLRNVAVSGTINANSFEKYSFNTLSSNSNLMIVACGDIDGDGRPDAVLGTQQSLYLCRNHMDKLPCTITNVDPLSAAPDATVTITGTGFHNTPDSNIVFFGATRALVTAASATSLTTKVPFGATYRTVSVFSSSSASTASARYPFLPVYDNSSYLPSKINFKSGTLSTTMPNTIASHDFDGDSKADLVVTNIGSNVVRVFGNTSSVGELNSASFATAINLPLTYAGATDGLAIRDIDRDGRADIVVYGGGNITLFRNTSSVGSLSFAAPYVIPFPAANITIIDLDNDGGLDLFVNNTNSFYCILNCSTPGNILFGEQTQVTSGSQISSITAGDLDGDNKPEVLVQWRDASGIFVYRNISTYGRLILQPAIALPTPAGESDIAIADMDGDGYPDVAASNSNNGRIYIFRNTGTAPGPISMAPDVNFPSGVTSPFRIAASDIDGDGKPDIAVLANNGSMVSVLRNTASAGIINASSLAAPVAFSGLSGAKSLTIGDLDGDRKPDIAITNTAGFVSLLHNEPLQPLVVGPTTICIGATTHLSESGGGGTWSSSNTTVATVDASGNVTAVWGGVAVIAYTVPSGSLTATITVNPALSAGIATPEVCQGLTTAPLGGSFGGDATSATWSDNGAGGTFTANDGSNPAAVTYTSSLASSLTVTLTLTSAGGACSPASASKPLTVNPNPIITAVNGNGPVCLNDNIQYTSTAGGGTSNISYAWSGPNNFSAAGPNIWVISATTAAQGVYTLIITDQKGCRDTALPYMEIVPLPVIDIITTNSPVCLNTRLDLDATVSSGSGNFSYEWTGPNAFYVPGSADYTAHISSVSMAAAGDYTLHVVDNYGCRDTATSTVVVNTLPSVMAIGSNAPVCEEHTLSLFSTVTGGAGSYIFAWQGPNGFTSADEDPTVSTSVTTAASGVYTFTATDTNSCVAASIDTVVIAVYAQQPITGNSTVLFGQTTTLSNPTPGGIWSTPTPWTTSVTPVTAIVKGISAGISEISYTTAQGCVSVHTITVASGVNVCVGQTIIISDGVSGGTWTSGAASIASVGTTTGMVAGVGAGRAIITHHSSLGAITTTVTVNPLVGTTAAPASVCQGQSLTVVNNTAGGGTWYSGNTATAVISSSGLVTGVTGGTVSIYFTPVAGCVTAKTVTIIPTPSITGASSVCAGQTTTMSNSGPGGAWSTSTGALATINSSGMVRGIAAGTPRISYIWPTGCYSTKTITVNPISNITTATGDLVCAGRSIAFANATPGGGAWTSSNTSVATVNTAGSITGVDGGVAFISFTTPPGCVATKSVTVRVSPSISGATAVCANQTISVSSGNSGGTWSSSSAAIASVSTAGVVKGMGTGVARISYVLPTGCYGTASVAVNPLSAITGGTAGMCQSGAMTLTNTTPGGGGWSSSNTNIATVSTTGVVRGAGTGMVTILFTTGAGCVATRPLIVNACRQADTSATTTVSEPADDITDINIFPNPNNGTFTLQASINTTDPEVYTEVTNMLGQIVYRNNIKPQNGLIIEQVDLGSTLSAGTYMLRMRTTHGDNILRFIVQ